MNDQLATVNRHLQDKVAELEAANHDIAHLFNSTDMATIVLDPSFHVKRFTPASTRLFHLIAADVGRPIGDIGWKFADADLLPDAHRVFADLVPREKMVREEGGNWFLRRILLYRTRDGAIDGLVLTFTDVTRLKQAEESLTKLNAELEQRVAQRTAVWQAANQELQVQVAERQRLAAIVESSDDAIIGKTLDGTITTWNAGAERLFGYAAAEVVGRSFAVMVPPEAFEELRQVYERIGHGERVPMFRTRRLRKDGQPIFVSATYSAVKDAAGRIVGLSLIDRDVTEWERMERTLRESRERLGAIVDTAADAIITIDHRGIIESVNPAAEQLFGYGPGELVGQEVAVIMPSPYREEHAGYMAKYLRTGVKKIIGTHREVRGQRKDGSTLPVDLAVSEIDHLRLFTRVLRDISQQKRLEREVLEISALEQRRIGQELHDDVGQELTGLNLMADALAQQLKDSPTAQELAAKVAAGLERVHQQVRLLSRGLVPVDVDPEGLRVALEELAARTAERSGTECTFACTGAVEVADATTATHLLRIAQEAVSNAVRHGRARHVQIGLQADGATLTLSIRDDGTGLPGPLEEHKGLGIRLMRNRAGLIGGTVTIGPADGGGTLVTCILSRRNRHE